jgi:uncharacterized protein YceK
MHKIFLLIILFASCAGCASIATWHYSDETLSNFLQNRRTHCDYLPRVYSGFYFDFCWLNSDPQRIYGSAPMALLLLDGLFSGIADTVALPVTLVKQHEYGVIPLKRPAKVPVTE